MRTTIFLILVLFFTGCATTRYNLKGSNETTSIELNYEDVGFLVHPREKGELYFSLGLIQ